MNVSVRRAVALCALLAPICLSSTAKAQTVPPPRFGSLDSNRVDMVTGRFVYSMSEGTIGAGDGAVGIDRLYTSDSGRTDQWSGTLYKHTSGGTSLMYVRLGRIVLKNSALPW